MEVDKNIYDLIIKESCCSLCYDYDERQFSYPLRSQSCLNNAWSKVLSVKSKYLIDFYLEDFNSLLISVERIVNAYKNVKVDSIRDCDLLSGEIINIKLGGLNYLRIMKMSSGQYLNLENGMGLSFGTEVYFEKEKELKTSEGVLLGTIYEMEMHCPISEHLALSRVFLKRYYNRNVSKSLWDIFDEACHICSKKTNCQAKELDDMAREMGIGSFVLLNIANAAAKI